MNFFIFFLLAKCFLSLDNSFWEVPSFVEYKECTHPIYCQGEILDTIQRLELFEDQKTFVDMPLKFSVEEVQTIFNKLKNKSLTKDEWKSQFIDVCFHEKGYEIHSHIPSDFKESPSFLKKIKDSKLRAWAEDVHKIWLQLSRVVVHTNSSDMYSSIQVPYPFVVPGGRFDGFFYWDSFFVIKGLLISEMYDSARSMILNMIYLLKEYGFIPNGMRVYFLSRSQPPLLTFMVEEYFKATKDLSFLNQTLPFLEFEYSSFWMTYRNVSISDPSDPSSPNPQTLNRYFDNGNWGKPRPESYMEDIRLKDSLKNSSSPEAASTLYNHIIAGAESGIDFSSKWFKDESQLNTIQTENIIPVELNSYLYRNELLLSQFHEALGHNEQSNKYQQLADQRKNAMNQFLYDSKHRCWFDYDLKEKKKIERFYLSNFFPLYAGFDEPICVPDEFFSYEGGNPFSLFHNKKAPQQWDFPNAWAPTSYFFIESLKKYKDFTVIDDEFLQVDKWISNAYCSYQKKKAMVEKYDVIQIGAGGGGGEYKVQLGFGWTNAVTLFYLKEYGHILHANSCVDFVNLMVFMCVMTSLLMVCVVCLGIAFLLSPFLSKWMNAKRNERQSILGRERNGLGLLITTSGETTNDEGEGEEVALLGD